MGAFEVAQKCRILGERDAACFEASMSLVRRNLDSAFNVREEMESQANKALADCAR
jgi:hypothetical protein